jgi:hypothetical protein
MRAYSILLLLGPYWELLGTRVVRQKGNVTLQVAFDRNVSIFYLMSSPVSAEVSAMPPAVHPVSVPSAADAFTALQVRVTLMAPIGSVI